MSTITTKPAATFTRATAQVQGVHLTPVETTSLEAAIDAALESGLRRRPVVARKPDGTFVACCSRTARKHGWTLETRLFDRANPATSNAPAKPAQASK